MTYYIISVVLILLAVWLQMSVGRRSAFDVAEDLLLSEGTSSLGDSDEGVRLKGLDLTSKDELSKAGIYTTRARKLYEGKQKTFPICVDMVVLALLIVCGIHQPMSLIIFSIMGMSFGYIIARYRLRNRISKYQRELEFNLPVVMERLVMAVQAGHHLLSALSAVIELERKQIRNGKVDSVTYLLEIVQRLTVAGLSFEKSTNLVSSVTEVPAVRHAFVHLGVAHAQGGDLIVPLKELSESTQLYYQESVEEQIAKLPVKATLPLLCTFAGMVLMFITPQILRITSIAGQVSGVK